MLVYNNEEDYVRLTLEGVILFPLEFVAHTTPLDNEGNPLPFLEITEKTQGKTMSGKHFELYNTHHISLN